MLVINSTSLPNFCHCPLADRLIALAFFPLPPADAAPHTADSMLACSQRQHHTNPAHRLSAVPTARQQLLHPIALGHVFLLFSAKVPSTHNSSASTTLNSKLRLFPVYMKRAARPVCSPVHLTAASFGLPSASAQHHHSRVLGGRRHRLPKLPSLPLLPGLALAPSPLLQERVGRGYQVAKEGHVRPSLPKQGNVGLCLRAL